MNKYSLEKYLLIFNIIKLNCECKYWKKIFLYNDDSFLVMIKRNENWMIMIKEIRNVLTADLNTNNYDIYIHNFFSYRHDYGGNKI